MATSIDNIWDKVLETIQPEVTDLTYRTWISPIIPYSMDEDRMYLMVELEFIKNTLESRYSNLISAAVSIVTQKDYKIYFFVRGNEAFVAEQERKLSDSSSIKFSSLNPKYTFESFVIGGGNHFAHAACAAVAENPAGAYNPLFLYSPAGLGKTHLLHAIGNYVLNNNPEAKVLYISSEKFMTELINSISNKTTEKFKEKYRTIDYLLIDDIQFLEKKESTQIEFFHTFNALYEANKQIIITSDKPPKGLISLEERLVSRFEMGLITEITPPDYETRIAILKKKAKIAGVNIDDSSLEYIAGKFISNIREIEGALNKVSAYSNITGQPITRELTMEALRESLPNNPKVITIKTIQEAVARYFNIKPSVFLSEKRTKDITYPRQIAMYLCRELTDASLSKIGSAFGNRNYTTIIYAYDKIKEDINNKPIIKEKVDELTQIISGNV